MSEFNFHQDKTVMLRYLAPDEVNSYVRQFGDRVACVAGYGNRNDTVVESGLPMVWVDTPVAARDSVFEVWTADRPVTHYRDHLISGAGTGDIFFGCISVPIASADDLSRTTQHIYSRIFEYMGKGGYPNLLRVWNYFPDINAVEGGGDRYQNFCVGRHEAFAFHKRRVEDSPSASVLGSHGGPMVVYFLASRSPGRQIENPRQTSAYHYPKEYGPRSPIFSRATLAFEGKDQTLFISGTASILGHVSVHPGAIILQTRETLANIRAVIDHAAKSGFEFDTHGSDMALKAYVRHAEDAKVVRDIVREEWGMAPQLIVLQADVCRPDLLMEAEAVCWNRAG